MVSCYWLDSRSLVTGKGRSFSLSFSAYRCKMGVKNFPAKRYLGAEGGGGVSWRVIRPEPEGYL